MFVATIPKGLIGRRLILSQDRLASTLILAEHDETKLNAATLNAVSAAKKLGGDISLLLAGEKAESVAKEAAAIPGVKKVLFAQDAKLAHQLPE